MAAYSPQQSSAGPGSLFERAVNRVGGPLAEAWLFPASSQSLPPEEHLIWHVGWDWESKYANSQCRMQKCMHACREAQQLPWAAFVVGRQRE